MEWRKLVLTTSIGRQGGTLSQRLLRIIVFRLDLYFSAGSGRLTPHVLTCVVWSFVHEIIKIWRERFVQIFRIERIVSGNFGEDRKLLFLVISPLLSLRSWCAAIWAYIKIHTNLVAILFLISFFSIR